jgi:hypothetical protein
MKEGWEDRIREAAQEYNPPPPTPREAIWARIEKHRRRRGIISLRPRFPWRWILVPATAAAAVIVGIIIGRQMVPQPTVQPSAQDVSSSTEEPWTQVDPLHHFVTSDYLLRTETLLAQFRSFRGNGELKGWARDLLVETRLIMDSPAAQNGKLMFLLRDLELVLAQIVRLEEGHGQKERQWIDDGLEQRAIMARLRLAIPTGPHGT